MDNYLNKHARTRTHTRTGVNLKSFSFLRESVYGIKEHDHIIRLSVM